MNKATVEESKGLRSYTIIAWMLLVLVGYVFLEFIGDALQNRWLFFALNIIESMRLPLLFSVSILVASRIVIKSEGLLLALIPALKYGLIILSVTLVAYAIEVVAVGLVSMDLGIFLAPLILVKEVITCVCWVVFFMLAVKSVVKKSEGRLVEEQLTLKRVAVIGACVLPVLIPVFFNGMVFPAVYSSYGPLSGTLTMDFLNGMARMEVYYLLFSSLKLLSWWLLALASVWRFSVEASKRAE